MSIATLAAYLLVAPPGFVFGPLAGLLLLSRPTTTREWAWLTGVLLWSALWLRQGGDLGAQTTRAAAVFLSGSFVALTLWRPSPSVSRALAATALAALAAVVWLGHFGIGWIDLQHAVGRDLAAAFREVRGDWERAGVPRALVEQVAASGDTLVRLYPGLLAVAAIAGLRLAWTWYHRIANHPWGAPPEPFSMFRFSDHLIWGVVVASGLCLLPVPPAGRLIGANLLLASAVLYGTRGLAILRFRAGRLSAPFVLVLAVSTLFLLPFVAGGLALVGLADTWVDFRRRQAAPHTGG